MAFLEKRNEKNSTQATMQDFGDLGNGREKGSYSFRAQGMKNEKGDDMGGCQNYGPFLGTLNSRGRIIVGIQKGTIILTTYHIEGLR